MKRDVWTVDMFLPHELSDGTKVHRSADSIYLTYNPDNIESFTVRRTPAGSEVIVSPGRFEGEETYVLIANDAYMNGVADEHPDGSISVKVDAQDKLAFPALARRQRIRLAFRDDGFVVEV